MTHAELEAMQAGLDAVERALGRKCAPGVIDPDCDDCQVLMTTADVEQIEQAERDAHDDERERDLMRHVVP